ncbi:MAG: hypothetical protein RLP02_35955 [Coleofasciculus sp. C2-GNP5-27]
MQQYAGQSVVICPDEQRFISGGEDYTIKIGNLLTKQDISYLRGHQARVTCLALSPDGKTLISADDSPDYVIKVWDFQLKH